MWFFVALHYEEVSTYPVLPYERGLWDYKQKAIQEQTTFANIILLSGRVNTQPTINTHLTSSFNLLKK